MKVWNCFRWMAMSLGLALVLTGTVANVAHAQKPKPDPGKGKGDKNSKPEQGQPTAGMEIAKVEGKWAAFSQGVIKILNAENQEIFLQSENETQIRYTAEAEPAWLMPGYMVRFSASFDQNSKPTAPLKAIEVFTPLTQHRLSAEEMREQTPGIHREDKGQPEEAKGLFNENNKKPPQQQPKGKPNKKETGIAPGQTFRVVGRIGNVQNNVLTIISSSTFQIEIDPAAVVTVTANDASSVMGMVAQGDSVSVSGLRNPAQPAQIYCEKITIKAAKKLTQAMPQAKRGKGSTRDKDSDTKNAKNTKDGKDKPDAKKPTSTDKKSQ